jgi:dolichol kinase
MTRNFRRGMVHVAFGLIIASLTLVVSRPLMILLLGLLAAFFIILDLVRLQWKQLNIFYTMTFGLFMREYEITRVSGASFLFLGSLVSLTLYRGEIAALAIAFLAIGDPLAHFFQSRYGDTKSLKKTLAGAIACFIGSAGIGLAFYFNFFNNTDSGINIVTVLAGAAASAIAHSLPIPVDDNLTMPVASGGVMWLLLQFWL